MEELARILEKCFAVSAWKRPDSIVHDEPDLFQVITPSVKFAYANGVYRSIFSAQNAHERVAKVTTAFLSRGLPFRWILFPSSQPSNMRDILLEAGFKKGHDADGLFLETSTEELEDIPKEIVVKEMNAHMIDDYFLCMKEGWGVPDEAAEEGKRATKLELAKGLPYISYVAYYNNEPAGSGILRYVDGEGYLMGGSVRPKFRSKGVYSAMIKHRVDVMLAQGARYALVQAITTTSSPILQKLGFKKLVSSSEYQKHP